MDQARLERLAQRVEQRKKIFARTVLEQLGAGVPILYRVGDAPVEEFPDGSRYYVEYIDGGPKTRKLRELL